MNIASSGPNIIPEKKNEPNQIAPSFLVLLLLALGALSGCGPRPLTAASAHGVVYETPQAIPDFTLTSENGPVGSQSWRGRLVVISFGYTYCPDVCPTILAADKQTIEKLGD
jgi:protein SCO1/2